MMTLNTLVKKLGITLISSKEFSEDNLMRYHFVTFSNENYDPSASYVLDYLKRNLNDLRSQGIDKNFEALKNFIEKYVKSLKDFFVNCEALIRRAEIETKFSLYTTNFIGPLSYQAFSFLKLRALS